MEINLNNNGLNNIGAVTITNAPRGVSSAEPVFDVPDSALSRDDALGKLVTAAFNFQPPPMPAFTD